MTDEEWPPAGLNLNELRAAGREVAACIKPVLEVEQGSGGLKQIGSSFILRFGVDGAIVTAAHTVSGPETKVIALMEGTATKWPREYFTVEGKEPGIPTADVAYAFGQVLQDVSDLMAGIGPDRLAVDVDFEEGASFMSIGYPASRAKVRNADASLRNEVFSVSGHRAANEVYAKLGLDHRVHIAVRYDPKSVRNFEGEWQHGAKPRGMSGGVLFAPMNWIGGATSKIVLLVAGVLTDFHPAPDNILVATRIDCVLDALAPGRSEELRTHTSSRVSV